MDERGGATGVEMALLWGVMVLLVLAVVQVTLVFYAGQLAATAAQDGVRSGRYFGSSSIIESARGDAADFLARAAGKTLDNVTITATVDETAGLLRVEVVGTAPSLIPGVPMTVSRTAVGGIERVAP